MCTLAMMVGEFNFGELFVKSEVTNNGTTQIMFVLFLVLVSLFLTSGATYSNLLQTAFSYKSVWGSFLQLTVWVCNFLANSKNIGAKIAC